MIGKSHDYIINTISRRVGLSNSGSFYPPVDVMALGRDNLGVARVAIRRQSETIQDALTFQPDEAMLLGLALIKYAQDHDVKVKVE